MLYKKPKNTDKYVWTNHVAGKMGYYRISESLVKRVARFPKRVEKGIAPGTTACMQPAGSKKHPTEIWVMFQEVGKEPTSNPQFSIINYQQKKKIITAWRYPGISPIGEPIPIPDDILAEIELAQD
ncbi:MAG: hypothetical protein A3I92_02795 [Candidatus Yanofskybacteria bacterium RIFCSPLOWO2_02_FULL_43_10b]|uniref:Uncharacterized protein n=1 Tax=Candidatus Yanofskybacteria bacterium RIFCSPLOWO2_02_FULL_43_10b TaxID=1802704 RepID=A0A1F8GZP7_9BACT|nr:MAG: hypothetical protein A3I92_02795 [Candidatus Yanofskybacteria bacterium RIFCSPLOWO2_02_FULL_43_10b]